MCQISWAVKRIWSFCDLPKYDVTHLSFSIYIYAFYLNLLAPQIVQYVIHLDFRQVNHFQLARSWREHHLLIKG